MSKTKFKGRRAGKPIERREDKAETLADIVKDKGFKSYKGKGIPVFKKGPNDPSWRTGNKLSTSLAASLPFFNPNGLPIDVARSGSGLTLVSPGIMRVSVTVSAGPASDYNSPVNMAARKVYSLTRRKNSGSKNYEAIDQMVYFLAMQQAYACCGWLQRLYRVINKFSATDRFQPRSLVAAMQVDYDDIKQHQAELAWLIRWMGNALNSLAVPKMPIFTASYDAFRHIYTDDSSPRKQIYMLDAYTFGTYNAIFTSAGGGLDFNSDKTKSVTWGGGGLLKYSYIYTMVHAIMDPILGDEDIGIIAGDILKAYEDSELFKVESDSMETLDLEYSEEILQQIHNLRTLSPGFCVFSGYEQVAGSANLAPYLRSVINFNSPAAANAKPKEYDIDAFSDNPSPEEVVNCTALQARINWELNTSVTPNTVLVSECCFDLLVPRTVELFLVTTSATPTYTLATEYSDIYLLAAGSTTDGIRRSINFDWAPFSYGLVINMGAGNLAPIGDIRMLAFFKYSVHSRIHENSVLSLFDLIEN